MELAAELHAAAARGGVGRREREARAGDHGGGGQAEFGWGFGGGRRLLCVIHCGVVERSQLCAREPSVRTMDGPDGQGL